MLRKLGDADRVSPSLYPFFSCGAKESEMKPRLSILMVLALLAALFAVPVTRADRPATGGVMTVAARSQAGQEARPFSADQQPAPWNPAALPVADETYFVDWNITASDWRI